MRLSLRVLLAGASGAEPHVAPFVHFDTEVGQLRHDDCFRNDGAALQSVALRDYSSKYIPSIFLVMVLLL